MVLVDGVDDVLDISWCGFLLEGSRDWNLGEVILLGEVCEGFVERYKVSCFNVRARCYGDDLGIEGVKFSLIYLRVLGKILAVGGVSFD